MILTAIRATVFICCAVAALSSQSVAAERHTLSASERAVVDTFLRRHHSLRMATRADCRCEDGIALKRRGTPGTRWEPIPDYRPNVAIGDFNGDGRDDLAVLFVTSDPYVYARGVLVIFNGPLKPGMPPSFSRGDVPLDGTGLFTSAIAPHRLLFGRFETDGCLYKPFGRGYREDCSSQ